MASLKEYKGLVDALIQKLGQRFDVYIKASNMYGSITNRRIVLCTKNTTNKRFTIVMETTYFAIEDHDNNTKIEYDNR